MVVQKRLGFDRRAGEERPASACGGELTKMPYGVMMHSCSVLVFVEHCNSGSVWHML